MTLEDGRHLFAWRGPNSIGQLADVIADACVLELFSHNGTLTRLYEGRLVPISLDILRGLITRHVAGVRLVSTPGGWEHELFSFEFPNTPNSDLQPNQKVLVELANLLLDRVGRAPREPSVLND